ncbi:MAG: hypothetical protein MI802_23475 [Desulfobacterales bacterium]|nr:hypothetical protein [Desulfobacterales bacterium]
MKITDPEVIKNGEKDLIDAVQDDLDQEAVREILKERLAVAKMASKGGQIVVHENQIAFRLDFEVNLSGSLLFDRDGNFIDDRSASSPAEAEPELSSPGLDMSGDEDISLTDGLPDMDDELPEEAFSFPDSDTVQAVAEEEEEDNSGFPDMDGESDADTELSIDLPDYGMDDEMDLDLPDDDLDLPLEDDDTDDDLGLDGDDLDLPLEDDNSSDDLDLTGIDEEDNLLMDDDDDLDINGELDDELDATDDLDDVDDFNKELDAQDLDDDINDILKESREFWEQKKE